MDNETKEKYDVVGNTDNEYILITKDGISFERVCKDSIPEEDRVNW